MIEKGELITLDNNEEYIVVQTNVKDNINYMFLMSNSKPVKVRFAKQLPDNLENVVVINNKEEKDKLVDMFKMNLEQ